VSDEIRIMDDQQLQHPIEALQSVVSVEEVLENVEAVKKVFISMPVKKYIVELSTRTRQSQDVYLGASPRGSLSLSRASQARAALHGRDHVLPDDVKALAVPVLAHRLIISAAARLRDVSPDRIVQEIVLATPAPGGTFETSTKES
ncbi:MAG TPA: MoxR family ATPase, partial [Anaerolineales bacterium]|nr:MoxR family ATPase [Anaerolineales bacterium]